MHLERLENKEAALKAAGLALTALFQHPGPILLLFSGGSLFELFTYLNGAALSQRFTIGMIDERYETDPNVNNFSQFYATAFAKVAAQRGAGFIDTKVQAGEDLESYARRMEAGWKDWAAQNPNGNIIATLGMGPDGHTAGIMPYPENKALFKRLFEDVKPWVVGYNAEGKHQYPNRATATLPFLQAKVDAAIVYVTGENKRAALERVLAATGSLAETPARIWEEMRSIQIFTDIKA